MWNFINQTIAKKGKRAVCRVPIIWGYRIVVLMDRSTAGATTHVVLDCWPAEIIYFYVPFSLVRIVSRKCGQSLEPERLFLSFRKRNDMMIPSYFTLLLPKRPWPMASVAITRTRRSASWIHSVMIIIFPLPFFTSCRIPSWCIFPFDFTKERNLPPWPQT